MGYNRVKQGKNEREKEIHEGKLLYRKYTVLLKEYSKLRKEFLKLVLEKQKQQKEYHGEKQFIDLKGKDGLATLLASLVPKKK